MDASPASGPTDGVGATPLGAAGGPCPVESPSSPASAGGTPLAIVGLPLQAAYCGAKFACRGFAESVRAELLAEGSAVTVSLVHLPAVNTLGSTGA